MTLLSRIQISSWQSPFARLLQDYQQRGRPKRKSACLPMLSWRFLEVCLLLSLLAILLAPSHSFGENFGENFAAGSGESFGEELPAWAPPHVSWEIAASKEETSLWPVLKNYGYHLPGTLFVIGTAYVSYHSSLQAFSPLAASIISSFSSRFVDFCFDCNTSGSWQDLGAKFTLYNIDLLNPVFSMPWLARRGLVMAYSLRQSIANVLPWPESHEIQTPTLVYLHDETLAKRIRITWVPASSTNKEDGDIASKGYAEITVAHHQDSCQRQFEVTGLEATLHGLTCTVPEKMNLKFRLYPRPWEGENRLFIQAFKDGKAGKLYLSPYHYGNSREVRFITDSIQQPHEAHWEHSLNTTTVWEEENLSGDCPDPLHSKVANPFHETSFELLAQVMNRSIGDQWKDLPDVQNTSNDANEPEELEPVLSEPEALSVTESIESSTLTLVSAGQKSILFIDWGGPRSRQPVLSLATATDLDEVTIAQLIYLESRRPGWFHDVWKLTFDILHMTAAQYLTSHYVVPVFEEWLETVHRAGSGKSPKSASEGTPDNSDSSSDESSYSDPSDEEWKPPQQMQPGKSSNNKPSRKHSDSGDSSDNEDDTPHFQLSGKDSYSKVLDTRDEHIAKKQKVSEKKSLASILDTYMDSDNEELDNLLRGKDADPFMLALARAEGYEPEVSKSADAHSRKYKTRKNRARTTPFQQQTEKLFKILDDDPHTMGSSDTVAVSQIGKDQAGSTKSPTHTTSGHEATSEPEPMDQEVSTKSPTHTAPGLEATSKPESMDQEGSPVPDSLVVEITVNQEVGPVFPPRKPDTTIKTAEASTQPETLPSQNEEPEPPARRTRAQTKALTSSVITSPEEKHQASAVDPRRSNRKRSSPRKLKTVVPDSTEKGFKETASPVTGRVSTRSMNKENKKAAPKRKRGRPPKSDKEKTLTQCFLHDCTNTAESDEKIWQHSLDKHIKKHFFSSVDPGDITIGNKVVLEQEDFNCRVGQCNKNFEKPSALASHLQKDHTEQLDQLPFNTYWKGKLHWLATELGVSIPESGLSPESALTCGTDGCTAPLAYKNDQQFLGVLMEHARAEHKSAISLKNFHKGAPLSSMSNTALTKRYLTRHGDGWHCHECSDPKDYESATINQTPEGLGQHWLAEHLDGNYRCPVKGCNTDNGKRAHYDSASLLLVHIRLHISAASPNDPDARIDQESIYPFTINPLRDERH